MTQGQHLTGDCGRVRHTAPQGEAERAERPQDWYEYSLDGEGYEEYWCRLLHGLASPASAERTFALANLSGEGPFELLVVVEGHFGYFRDSRAPAVVAELRTACDRGGTLEAVVFDETRSLQWRRAAFDCEASVGLCDGWLVETSCLPWRVGRKLELVRPERLEPLEGGAALDADWLRQAVLQLGRPAEAAVVYEAAD